MLLDPYTRRHVSLEYAVGTHLQCFASRVHAGLFCTVSTNGASRSILRRRSSLLDLYTNSIRRQLSAIMHQTSCVALICSKISPPMLCHFRSLQTDVVPHNVYSPQTKQSTRPLYEQHSAWSTITLCSQPIRHATLEYAVGTHLQCFASRVHAGLFRSLQTDGVPHTVYSLQPRSLLDLYTDINNYR